MMAQVSTRAPVTAKKHIYDGVLSSQSQSKLNSTAFPCFSDDDLEEIFGCSNGFDDHGVCGSIPIMELHVSDDLSGCSSRAIRRGGVDDYCAVFGGDDLDEELDLFDGVELFDQLKKMTDNGSDHLPRSYGFTNQAIGSFDSCQFQNSQAPTNGLCSSSDDLNHLQQKNNEIPANEIQENSHEFLVRATPESTSSFDEVGPSQMTQTSRAIETNTELRTETYLSGKAKFSRHCSIDLDVMERKSEKDINILKASLDKESSSADTSHGILQPSDDCRRAENVAGDDAFSVSAHSLHEVSPLETQTMIQSEIEFPMEYNLEKKEKISRNTSSECIVEEETTKYHSCFQRTSGLSESSSATLLHDTIQPTNETYGATHEDGVYDIPGSTCSLHEVSPQKIQANGRPMVEADTEQIMEINLAKRGKRYRCASSGPVADKEKNEQDAGFHKVSGFSESDASVTSDNTCLANSAVIDDAEAENSFDLGKKQHRHYRMNSLDLGDRKQAHKREARFQQSSRLRGSYSFDASHDRYTAHFGVHCSTSSENSPYRGNGGSPPSLDDQLDINSVAAISAATLQRAVEEAEMRIQSAKKLRFKDTLKTKIMVEEEPEDVFRQDMMLVNWGRVNHPKHASLYSGKDVLETAQVEQAFEDHKSFVKKDESILAGNFMPSKFTEESDKRGGEWEAAKQLNQLISGVKNKIASFMSWQAEKKEDPKEVQVKRHLSHQFEKKDEPEEAKESEKNQSADVCASEMTLNEDKIRLIPVAEELEENVNTRCNIVDQETVGDKVDKVPETVGPTNTNFLFFSFNCEKSWNHIHTEVEMEADQKCWKIGTENGQEELMNEAKNVEIREGSDDICETLDCGRNLEEIVDMEEDLYCVDEHEKSECLNEEDDPKRLNEDHRDDKSVASHEEGDNKILNEDHRDDRSVSTHEDSIITDLNDEYGTDSGVDEEYQIDSSVNGEPRDSKGMNVECGDDESTSICDEENRKEANEECEDDRIKLPCEEDEDKMINDNCGDYTSQFTSEVDIDRMFSDEHEGRSIMSDQEDDERTADVEHEDDISRFSYEKNGERKVDMEHGDDIHRLNDEKDDERTVDVEHEDEISRLNDETDDERTVDMEHGDDICRLNDEKDDERTVDVEHEDDISRLSDEKDDERTVDVEQEDDGRLSDEKDNERTLDMERGDDGRKFTEEEIRRLSVSHEEKPVNSLHSHVNSTEISENDDEWYECEMVETTEEQPDHAHLEESNLVGCQEFMGVQGSNDYAENESGRVNGLEEEDKRHERQSNDTDGTDKKGAEEASCIAVDDDTCGQTENEVLSMAEEATNPIDGCDPGVKEPVFPDAGSDIVLEISDYSSEPEMDMETSELLDEEDEKKTQMADLSSDHETDIENQTFAQMETSSTENIGQSSGADFVDRKTDPNSVSKDTDFKEMESISCDILENHTDRENQNEYENTQNVEEVANVGDGEGKNGSVQPLQRRRRWFDFGDRPNIPQSNTTDLENEHNVLEGSHSVDGTQIHPCKLDILTKEETSLTEAETTSKQEDIQVNAEVNHKRRRWFVKRGDEGVPEPPNLFAGLKVASDINQNLSDGFADDNESRDTFHVKEAAEDSQETQKQNVDTAPRRKRWFESEVPVEPAHPLRNNVDTGTTSQLSQEYKQSKDLENGKLDNVPILAEKDEAHDKVEMVNEHPRDLDEVKRRKKEKKKERIAVARVIREARERAFFEARERATMKACQTARSGAEERPCEFSADESYYSHKASMEEKIRAERAAVEKATLEARQRALKKALSDKAGKHPTEKSSSLDPKCNNSSSQSRCSESMKNDEKFDGADGASGKRHKARSERQSQTFEQTDKSLEEKNQHNVVAQKEQAARNMFTDTLDAEFRRWSCGKEGNLRALLSTLHYILGSDSGWQAVSVIDLVEPTAVRKAYKKATLFVHPDKLQQRGATIQQKYICVKVFNLLKDAWSKFNPNEC